MSKRSTQITLSIMALLTLVVFLTGCGQSAQRPGQESERVTVMLDWYPNTNHTGLYTAIKRGYFAAEGLEVEVVQSGESGVEQAVGSGRVDFGFSSQEQATYAMAEGVPIVSIAALMQHNTSAFASLKESGIESIKDFEGKRYGGWGSPSEAAVIKAIMEKHGTDFSKLEMITLGQADFFATIGREADIEWIYYGWDGVEAERRGVDLNVIFLKDLDPVFDYYAPLMITSRQMIEHHPDKVKRFLRALARGYADALSDPEAGAAILLEYAPELNPDLVRNSQAYLAKVDQQDQAEGRPYWGYQNREVWARNSQWLYENGLIARPIDVDQAFTNDFLPGAEAQ
ncbi:MAG TPA: ABC transporter substrate-binding protein [Symbiobacteriaceae bacterium]